MKRKRSITVISRTYTQANIKKGYNLKLKKKYKLYFNKVSYISSYIYIFHIK